MYTRTASRQLRACSNCQVRSVTPSTNSIATYTSSPNAPTSYTVTMLGCRSLASACASRSSLACASPPLVSVYAGRTSLIATLRSSCGS
jgi:hypothetical protein